MYFSSEPSKVVVVVVFILFFCLFQSKTVKLVYGAIYVLIVSIIKDYGISAGFLNAKSSILKG